MSDITDKPIAVCVCKIHDETIGEITKSVCSEAKLRGFSTVIYNSFTDFGSDGPDMESSENVFEFINFEKFCAVIILAETFQSDEILEKTVNRAKNAGIPVVSIDKELSGCTNILFDYGRCFEKIVRHMVEYHKFRDIFFIAGIEGNSFSEERLDVFKKVLKENNIPFDENKVGYGQFWDYPAEEALRKYLDSAEHIPEAVICANDLMAIGACREIVARGLSVPQDIAITGFDGINQEKYHTPRFTTARQDCRKAGSSAVEAVISLLEGKPTPENIKIDYSVVFSQSCGCAPLVYKNINGVVMDLCYKLRSKDELSLSLNRMTNKITSKDSVRDALFAIEKYIGMVYFAKMSINLRYSVLSEEKSDCSKHISIGEKMKTVVVFSAANPEDSDVSFTCGDLSVIDGIRTEDSYCSLIFLLKYQEKVYGYLALSFDPAVLDFSVLYFFSMSLNHAFDTVRNKIDLIHVNDQLVSTNSRLEEAFIHDSMTCLLNRRGFFMKIQERMRLFRKGYVFVSSIDLDNLKYINDKFGHYEGDFAIKNIANTVTECCGEDGICARFGGDEFVAVIVCGEKRDNFEDEFKKSFTDKLCVLNNEYSKEYLLSASVGSTVYEITPDFDLDAAIREADAKMYRDKESKGFKVRNYS